MSDDRTPPTHLAGEFPGRAETVRAMHYSDRFGVVAAGLDPDVALDIAAADPTAETTWNALGTALRALAEVDCNPAAIMDYLAVQKCGIEAEEWREATNSANVRTIRQNAKRVSRKLVEGDEGGSEDRDR